jgi:hypothetical protein
MPPERANGQALPAIYLDVMRLSVGALREEVNLDHADTSTLRFAAYLGCVLSGLKRGHKSSFEIVSWL